MRWRIEQQADGTWQVLRPDGTLVASIDADTVSPWRARSAAIEAMVTGLGGAQAMVAALTAADVPPDGEPVVGQRWASRAAFEGVVTNDGRVLAAGTSVFRDTPLPLMLQTVTAYGHDGAELVGYADTTGRDGTGEGCTLTMGGVFQTDEHGVEATQLLTDHGTFGVSIDPGWPDDVVSECVAMDADGWCSRWRDTYVGTPVIGLTMTPFPAFASASIWLEGTDPGPLTQQDVLLSQAPAAITPDDSAMDDVIMLLASAAPTAPPAAWFDNPGFTPEHPHMQFTEAGCPAGVPVTITDEGRVYGHIATWGTCHTGMADRCVTPPTSPSAYAYFRTGAVRTAEGSDVPVGQLTLGCGHASLDLGHRATADHYDNSGAGWADVAVGEDEFGIWFSGAIRPGLTEAQLRAARALSLSGDWRPIGGKLELLAALSVNVPGFPIPRGLRAVDPAEAMAASAMPAHREQGGQIVALVAAGMVVNRAVATDPLTALVAAVPALAPVADALRDLAAGQAVLLLRTEPMTAAAADALRARVASLNGN